MTAVLFVLGVYLAVRVLAALHRVRDLWYTIRTAWLGVVGGLLGWGGVTLAIAILAGDALRPSLLWGLASYVVFYASLFPLFWLYSRAKRAARLRERPASDSGRAVRQPCRN